MFLLTFRISNNKRKDFNSSHETIKPGTHPYHLTFCFAISLDLHIDFLKLQCNQDRLCLS